MLKFIFGRPASGKTYTVINEIKHLTEMGRECVLIVPEQFSFESEKAILKALGDNLALNVSVMSFSRLCDEVGRNVGGIAGVTLSNADKVIFMNRALISVASELKVWQKYCRSVAFAKTMLDAVGEFKINSVSSDELKKAAERVEGATLKQKLSDLAKIYESYDALVGERFIDTADNLTKLYQTLEGYHFFECKEVFIDSFKGFTGQQFKIIDRILSQASNLTICMTNDLDNTAEYGIFANIRSAVERIRKSADKFGVSEVDAVVLKQSRYNSEALYAVERVLSGDIKKSKNDGTVTVCSADTRRDEAEFAAKTIRRLVRTNGYRYRDFVIIARDADMYEDAVTAACKSNAVACFSDKRIPLSAFPISAAANAALNAALNLSSENILRFHKTGLGTLSIDEISRLENYIYLWQIDSEKWTEYWSMDPRGFVSEALTEKEENELKQINELREKAVLPILRFLKDFSGSASDMAAAIFNLLEECKAGEKLAEMSLMYKKSGNEFSSDTLKQSYDIYIRLLDSVVNCFGSRSLTKKEFCDALCLAVSFETVGVIPRMLDEVTFGAADRIRPSRPKVAIILGANQGVFPKTFQNTGVLSLNERRSLVELGVEIQDNAIFSVIDENYLVYCNLCCPSDRLYICYSKHGISGEPLEISTFVSELTDLIDLKPLNEPVDKITLGNTPETEAAAYTEYCRRFTSIKTGAQELKAALIGTNTEQKIKYIDETLSSKIKSIESETAKKLFGSDITLSATRIDTFNKCPFSFFCQYGISAKKLRPVDFDVLNRGTIVHFVLEKIITKYKKDTAKLTIEEIATLVDFYINEYLNSVSGYRTVENQRSKFLVSRVSRSLKEVVIQLARELAQSDFEPVACELKIGGKDGEISLEMPFDGGKASLVGSIDRVDEYNGYIRVIDYKTGSRKFKLPDVLFGLNLQMLLYLYTVVRAKGLDDDKAAGILYMPSKRDLDNSGMAMNGLLQSDRDLVSAMDKGLSGEFVPKMSFLKNGDIDKRCTSFIPKENFSDIFDYIERIMVRTAKDIKNGNIAVNPIDGRDMAACKYCDFSACCGIENTPCGRVPELKNDEVFEKMKEATEGGN